MSCLVLKPCCLPHVSLGKQWSLGGYVFPVKPVAVRGRHAGGRWVGESRAEMAPKFARWVDDLTCAVDVGQGGSKQVLRVPFGGSPCGTGALAEAKAGQGWGREQSMGAGHRVAATLLEHLGSARLRVAPGLGSGWGRGRSWGWAWG